MHLDKKPTSDEISKARRGGYRNKRPRKPKANASLPVMENWAGRYNEWCKGVKQGVKDYATKDKLRTEIRTR